MASHETTLTSAGSGSTIRAKRMSPLAKAAALAAEMVDVAERPEAARIVGKFYEHVPPGDIIGRGPRDLCGAALSLWRFAERRRPT